MTGKKKLGGFSFALAPLGVAVLIAGCGGGSAVSTAGGTTVIPPSGPTQYTKVSLTFRLAGRSATTRRPHAQQRRPQYISNAAQTITLQVVASGAPSPWPSPMTTTFPTAAPTPTSSPCECPPPPTASPVPLVLSTTVPVGNDVFYLDAKDASGYLLSTTRGNIPSPVPDPSGGPPIPVGRNQVVSPNSNNNLQITLLPVVDSVFLDTNFSYYRKLNNDYDLASAPVANQRSMQTQNVYISEAWDAEQSYDIHGPFANTIVLSPGFIPQPASTPCGLCAGVIRHTQSAGGASSDVTITGNALTMDYPGASPNPVNHATVQFAAGGHTGGQYHTEILSDSANPQPVSGTDNIHVLWPFNFEIDPDFYVFVPNGNQVNVIEGSTPFDASNTYVASEYPNGAPITGFYGANKIAAGGILSGGTDYNCPGAGYAAFDEAGDGGVFHTFTVPAPRVDPWDPPDPITQSAPKYLMSSQYSNAIAIGPDCTAWDLEYGGYLASIPVSGSATETPLTPTAGYSWDTAAILSDGNLYAPNVMSGGYLYSVNPTVSPAPASNTGVLNGTTYGGRKVVTSPDRTKLYFTYYNLGVPHIASCNVPCTAIVQDAVLTTTPTALAVSRDGSKLFVGLSDGTVIDYATAGLSSTDSTSVGSVLGLAVSPDDTTVFVVEAPAQCGSAAACVVAHSAQNLATVTNWNQGTEYPLTTTSPPPGGIAISP